MSGGYFDYKQHIILDLLNSISSVDDIKLYDNELLLECLEKMPKLNNVAIEIGRWFYDYIHTLDGFISGDTGIDCFEGYQDDEIQRLKEIIKDC